MVGTAPARPIRQKAAKAQTYIMLPVGGFLDGLGGTLVDKADWDVLARATQDVGATAG